MNMDGIVPQGVSEAFLDALDALAQRPSWWRDVLLNDDVFIAVRSNSLNVYHRGASIFRIDDGGAGRIVPWTHTKYLIRQQQVLARLHDDDRFEPADIGWSTYESPTTLKHMIRSAADLAGAEKSGLHPLILSSKKVIDVEVSLLRANDSSLDITQTPDESEASLGADSTDRSQDRLDIVTVEPRGDTPFIVFHEAKHFSNPALRANAEPRVLGQLKRYQATIKQHEAALKRRYVAVCQALVRLHQMCATVRADSPAAKPVVELSPLVEVIAAGQVKPEIDSNPRLIVFGFDADQRDGRWERDAERLREHQPSLKIKAIGNTRSVRECF